MTRLQMQSGNQIKSRPSVALLVIIGGLFVLGFAVVLSVSVGAVDIEWRTVWTAIFQYDPSLSQHRIIMDLRLPRTLGSVMVGVGFAVAGAVMQGMTRNPLADSGLLGLNAGAAFVLAICFAFFPELSFIYLILYCFVGAGIGAGLVFGIGSMSRGGLTPVRLTLAGAAVSALLTALSEGIGLLFHLQQSLAFWYAGGVAGTTWSQLGLMAPWVIAGLIAAIILSRSVTLLSLGSEVATGLGQRTRLVQTLGMLVVLVLAGSAVSAVGSVAFVGLIIPHVARFLVGRDYRWIIPCSAVLGALLMVLADTAARTINPPYETPVGALIALIGVPFFLYLARKQRGEL
ncbi:MAG TPA: iron ABC transporter permease [Bacillales bacterium]